MDVLEYLDVSGRSPFGEWFSGLNPLAASEVATALARLGQGNFSKTKGVGEGVYEHTIHFGPGYHLYFGKDGERVVVLLGGGTKKRQQTDIKHAITRWQDYKRRKR